MKLINSWSSPTKQLDKLDIKVRVGFLTVVALYADWSSKEAKITLLNFTLSNK